MNFKTCRGQRHYDPSDHPEEALLVADPFDPLTAGAVHIRFNIFYSTLHISF